MQHNFFFRKFNENYRKQESEYRKMTHEEWQEGFSQIRKVDLQDTRSIVRGTTAAVPHLADSQLCLHCEGTIAKGETGTK